MKPQVLIVLLGVAVAWPVAAGENTCVLPTNAPSRIKLRDQFDALRILTFPNTNLTLLTVADKAGSEQLEAWVVPIKERFPEGLVIEGIADVSAVPGPLRGLVRRRFQKAQSHSVMLDWSGDTVKRFSISANQANVLLVDGQGNILKRMTGKATEEAIKELSETIEQHLSETRKQIEAR